VKKETLVNHPPPAEPPAGNRPLVAPIYQSVKFEFEDLEHTLAHLRGEEAGYWYSRSANPTTRQLELTLAQLQGREDCLVTASGAGAVAQTLLGLSSQGEHVLCFVESYTPTRFFIRRVLARFGVAHTLMSIERTLAERPTRLVVFESPTNPVTKVADIAALTRLAHAHGALAVLDNTFAGLHQHGDYEVDVYLHSLTKFASGTGDVLGGAVIARAEIISKLRTDFAVLGGTLDAHAAYLVQRGLKTYFVRYRTQSASALALAERLAAHPAVERVHYPGLPSHPQHALARAQMREFGAIVSLDLKGGEAAASRFVDALELFAITASLGSTESLALPPQILRGRDFSAEQQRISGIGDGTVRLAIGLEDPEDLARDVTRALEAAG